MKKSPPEALERKISKKSEIQKTNFKKGALKKSYLSGQNCFRCDFFKIC